MAALLALSACATGRAAAPQSVRISRDATGCWAETLGKHYRVFTDTSVNDDLDQLTADARHWPAKNLRVEASGAVPYKCVGGAIYAFQRAGKRVGFVVESPTR